MKGQNKMRITPITNANFLMRYRKINTTKVLDSFTNQIFKTSNADTLISKLNKIGLLNSKIIDANATRRIQRQLFCVVA